MTLLRLGLGETMERFLIIPVRLSTSVAICF